MDVDADVAVVGDERSAGVEADPHPHGPPRPAVLFAGALDRECSFGRRLCLPEGGEVLVAARVDLVPARRADPFAQQPAHLAEHLPPGAAVLAGEPRRAFDIGEEEGDGAARQLAHAGSVGTPGGSQPGGALGPAQAAASSSSGLRQAAYANGW